MIAVENREELIFSLDIGTRTVIGIVGKYNENNQFKVLSCVIKEHDKRNMYDGQIHDIEGVTNIVKEIKNELEEELEVELRKVSIAAAGRSLRTCRIRIDKEIDPTREIDRNIVEALELEAIQKAQENIDISENDNKFKYYCIGYSVVRYYLDDSFMENLEGHRGKIISVDLLATFLPQIVIDSLYSVVSRADLEIANITLEPIAAINVAIKENLRLLNLALVDIGAGTSDIAITKDGTIVAYAMTSIAGDEITEKLAQTYLLDFNTSENLKIRLNKEDNHKFKDIVGIEHNLTTKEIIEKIQEVIDRLAKEIGEKIIKFNGKSPSAVFLIGGSSQIPLLKEKIAKYLELPEERVVVKDVSSIDDINGLTERLKGPDIVTPIGIAFEGIHSNYKNFIKININGEEVRVFNTENIKVADVLVIIAYNPRKLIPENGDDFIYYINGEKKIIKGELGEPAKIFVNDEKASLSTRLNDEDCIKIIDGTKGIQKKPYVKDCISTLESVIFNNKKINLIKNIKINGKLEKENIRLNYEDDIEYERIDTLEELFCHLKLDIDDYIVLVNGKEDIEDYKLKDKDIITAFKKSKRDKKYKKKIKLIINGEEKIFSYNKKEFVFVDIFDYIDFDLSKPKGRLVLKVNGRYAEYMEPLKELDNIEIYWDR